MVDRGHRRAAVASSGGAVVLVGSFLPWLRSGARSRSSYDLLEIVDRLGFSPDGAVGWAVRLWPLLPLLLVLVVVGHWAGPAHPAIDHAARIGAALVAVYAAGTAVAIVVAPEVALFAVGAGPWVTLAGAALLAASVSRGWAARAAS